MVFDLTATTVFTTSETEVVLAETTLGLTPSTDVPRSRLKVLFVKID